MQSCQEFLREMDFLVVNYAGRHALLAGSQVTSLVITGLPLSGFEGCDAKLLVVDLVFEILIFYAYLP